MVMLHETIRNDDFQVNIASVQMLEQIKSRKRLTDFARFFFTVQWSVDMAWISRI